MNFMKLQSIRNTNNSKYLETTKNNKKKPFKTKKYVDYSLLCVLDLAYIYKKLCAHLYVYKMRYYSNSSNHQV